MDVVSVVLIFLLTVVVSGFFVRLLPIAVPLPIVQIALGAGLSMSGFNVAFDSHLFLLLFIPPLLFLDGWRIPKGALFRDWRTILALAIGLVVFTVGGMGVLIHWMLPAMPLAVAFALAAILSPTDPVAVSAMTATSPVPSRLMHILEGESLLNDASGLVCFSFAVTAALTGTFSMGEATLSFAFVAGGGVVVGVAVTWLIGRCSRFLVKRVGEDSSIQILISLLIPFAAYLAAEHIGVSGILAAAVAGIAMHYAELIGRPLPATRMQRNAVWDTIQTALNGIIFVLLGEQLPGMLRDLPAVAASAGVAGPWHLLGYAALITLGLGAMRFAWVWTAVRVTAVRAERLGKSTPMPKTRLLAVTATAGVRGAITLAGILTLPLTMLDGSAFPGRDVAIFIAMAVILFSLTLASIGLPLLTRGLAADLPDAAPQRSEENARTAAAEAAIRRIDALNAEPESDELAAGARAQAVMRLRDAYQRRIDYGDSTDEDAAEALRAVQAERALRVQALRAERNELYRLRRARAIDDDVHQRLLREIDLQEASLTQTRAH